jgi:hypothetical protein
VSKKSWKLQKKKTIKELKIYIYIYIYIYSWGWKLDQLLSIVGKKEDWEFSGYN